ncbi:DUF3291 domain-containing protein [Wenxinia saemankumensis]|uniref:DUF3291 domain-containing protein n=1 Tax=Wenxinia saemankumensis TaxID=1447782 RepID=A0A1M6HE56_9RHOB|nr:DUF3291 domain-containing protein [Wenxinia saemankumensis]SHJ20497.1 protein of unknown function [Wenxinia saemankumensis]
MHLAEFNRGILRHDWDDPRLAEFTDNLDRVNAVAARSRGFVWMMPPDQMEAAQTDPGSPLGPDPRLASTLSVWTDARALHDFAFRSVHRRFFDRRDAWFAPQPGPRLVLWHVPEGHRPDAAEAADRMARLARDGASDRAFGWDWLRARGEID